MNLLLQFAYASAKGRKFAPEISMRIDNAAINAFYVAAAQEYTHCVFQHETTGGEHIESVVFTCHNCKNPLKPKKFTVTVRQQPAPEPKNMNWLRAATGKTGQMDGCRETGKNRFFHQHTT